MKNLLIVFFVMLIRLYQLAFSPLLGHRCRFHPRCSDFALESLRRYGLIKGIWLAVKRVGCCHPWHRGGFDPVP